jgi:hypothetical protein
MIYAKGLIVFSVPFFTFFWELFESISRDADSIITLWCVFRYGHARYDVNFFIFFTGFILFCEASFEVIYLSCIFASLAALLFYKLLFNRCI